MISCILVGDHEIELHLLQTSKLDLSVLRLQLEDVVGVCSH